MAKTPKKDKDEKKISGINKFLYRGYEVYDSEGNVVNGDSCKNATIANAESGNADVYVSSTSVGNDDAEVMADKGSVDKAGKKKEPAKYCKRPIRDVKVWENLNAIADPVIRGGLSSPMFDGDVNQQFKEIKLSLSKGTVTKRLLISEIISMQQHVKINDEAAYVKYEDEDDSKTIPIHRDMVAFLKALIMCQYNASQEFSQIVAGYACEVFLEIVSNDFHTPIFIQTNSKLQEVILKELNEYYVELLTACNIRASEVVTEQLKKSKKGSKRKKDQTIIEELIDSAATASEVE